MAIRSRPAILSLCSGVGLADLAARLVWPEARSVGYVERESYAASLLVARMEETALDPAPVWDDLATFDGGQYRGRVDLVTSGLPCQPYSSAGHRAGNEDERALWPHFVRVVGECEPAAVFLENVPAFLGYAEPVWTELRSLGFEWSPPVLATASEFGAPHERTRVFLFASHPDRYSVRAFPERGEDTAQEAERPTTESEHVSAEHANPDRSRLEGLGHASAGRAESSGHRESAADAAGDGSGQGDTPRIQTGGEDAQGRRVLSTFPHGRGLPREWKGWQLSGLQLRHDANGCGLRCGICRTPWEAESPLVRVADGYPGWVDELRTVGNGVVPVVAAYALGLFAEDLVT